MIDRLEECREAPRRADSRTTRHRWKGAPTRRTLATLALAAFAIAGCGDNASDATAAAAAYTSEELAATTIETFEGTFRWTLGLDIEIDPAELEQIVALLGGTEADMYGLDGIETDKFRTLQLIGSKGEDRTGSFGLRWADLSLGEVFYDASDAPTGEQIAAMTTDELTALSFRMGLFAQTDLVAVDRFITEMLGATLGSSMSGDGAGLRQQARVAAEANLGGHSKILDLVLALVDGHKAGVAGKLDMSTMPGGFIEGFGDSQSGEHALPQLDRDDLHALLSDVLTIGEFVSDEGGLRTYTVGVDFGTLGRWVNDHFEPGTLGRSDLDAYAAVGMIADAGTVTVDDHDRLTRWYVNLVPIAAAFAGQVDPTLTRADIEAAVDIARKTRLGIVLHITDHGQVGPVGDDAAVTITWEDLAAYLVDLDAAEAVRDPNLDDPAEPIDEVDFGPLPDAVWTVAVAQDTHFAETGAYTTDLDALAGYYTEPLDEGVQVTVAWVTDHGFCVQVTDGVDVMSIDTGGGGHAPDHVRCGPPPA